MGVFRENSLNDFLIGKGVKDFLLSLLGVFNNKWSCELVSLVMCFML